MKNVMPDELVSLYGTMAISRIATMRTKATLGAAPDVLEALKKYSKEKGATKSISINDLDVENGGMDEEFEDFMTAGFEQLIPGFGGLRPRPFPIPDMPTPVRICGKVARCLGRALAERDEQQEAAERLQALVTELGKNAHPLVVIFAALFRAALQEVEDRLAELQDEIDGLIRMGVANDCF